jgi:hypothetical protein
MVAVDGASRIHTACISRPCCMELFHHMALFIWLMTQHGVKISELLNATVGSVNPSASTLKAGIIHGRTISDTVGFSSCGRLASSAHSWMAWFSAASADMQACMHACNILMAF